MPASLDHQERMLKHLPGNRRCLGFLSRIEQRTKTDCGVACVAMLARVDYDTAKAAFRFTGKTYQTSTKACVRALRRLGVKLKSNRLLPLGPDPIEILTSAALVKANMRRRHWHWVVYDPASQALIDPLPVSDGPIIPSAYLPCEAA